MKRRRFFHSLFSTGLGLPIITSVVQATKNDTDMSVEHNKNNIYDVIVVGVGSMGAAACYYLSKSGAKVLGIEQFEISHNKGSHSGQSRIIRKAYFEHPDYVPLLEQSYKNWLSIEKELSVRLMEPTGLVYFADSNHDLLQEVRSSANEYGIDIQNFNAQKAMEKFPSFSIPTTYEAIFEPQAGFIAPEKTIQSMVKASKDKGAEIHTGEKVITWSSSKGKVSVITDQGQYEADKLILCAGVYTLALSEYLKPKLQVTQQLLSWVKPKNPFQFELGNFPCWVLANNEDPGVYYGFPILSNDLYSGPQGLKIAHHARGTEIEPSSNLIFDAEQEKIKLKVFLEKFIPDGFEEFLTVQSCMYTYSPDDDFIIDFLPNTDQSVIVACGFSGHGFKFVPVIGEILSDLASKGKTDLPIDFLSLERLT